MKPEIKKRIEEIIDGMKCPKGFKCAKSGFEILCEAKDLGMKSYLKCLDESPRNCKFTITYGHSHFCQCPLRVYLAKELVK